MANKKNQLDDFDFDDLNFDSLSSEPGKADRDNGGPIRKMSKSFGEGAGDAFKDPQVLRRFASSALPDGYGTAMNATADLMEGGAELYNIAAKELRPALPAMRRAAGRLAQSGKSVLPKKIQEKLDAFSKDSGQSRAASQEDLDSANIAQELGGVFAASIQQQASNHAQVTIERKIRERVEDKYTLASLKRLDAIRGGLDRLTSYQDQITIKYQQKSLELQYRQLFATKEILALHKTNSQRDFAYMQAMLRNTSMSDGAKASAEMKEDSKMMNRMKNQFQQGIVRHFGTFGKQIQQNLANSMRSALGGFSEALSMANDADEMLQDANEMGADVNATGEIARYLGKSAVQKVMQFASAPIRNRIGKNKKVTGFGARLNYFFQNLPEHITNAASTSTNGDSVLSDIVNLFKEMIPRKGLDLHFGESPIYTADAPASFDMQTRRSITEVIPGYLSRIHHEILKIRTGDHDIEQVTYNMSRGNFSTLKTASSDAMRQVFNPRTIGQARSGIDDFITQQIDPEGKLSAKARDALKKQIFVDTTKGTLFDPKRFVGTDHVTTELMGKEKDEVGALIQARYMTGDRDDDSIAKNTAAISAKRLQNAIPDVKSAMTGWRDAGQKELLMRHGLINSFNGVDTVNMQRVMEMILNDAESDSTADVEKQRSASDAIKARLDGKLGRAAEAISDVFVNGSDSPILQGTKIEMGEYRDAVTKDIIRSVDEIKGPVINLKGQIVVTAEQALTGLRDSKTGQILRKAQEGAKRFLNRFQPQIAQTQDYLKRAQKETSDFGAKVHDIWVTGDTEPAIQAIRLKAGFYRDAITKEVIHTVDQIKGPVMDAKGNMVLKASDFITGLKDSHGHKLDTLTQRAKDTTKSMYDNLVGATSGLFNPTAGTGGPQADAGPNLASEMSLMIQLNSQQVELLTGIHEILATRNFVAAPGEGGLLEQNQQKSWMQRIKNMPKAVKGAIMAGRTKAWGAVTWSGHKIKNGLGWGVKKAGSLYGSYVRGVLNVGAKVLAAPFKMAGLTSEFMSDVFVQGGKDPALYAKKMRNGDYLDRETGTVIKSVRDIKGAVIDVSNGTPNIVLTQEEFNSGLFDSRGRKIGKNLLGKLTTIFNAAVGGYGALIKLPFMLMKGAGQLAGAGIKRAFRQPDIYVKSDRKTPRIRGILLEQGDKYWSVKSDKFISKHQHIDGQILGADKREVISQKEFEEGLVDYYGKPVGTIAEKIAGAISGTIGFAARQVGKLARGYAQVMGGALGFGKDALVGMFGKLGGIFNPKIYTSTSRKTNDLLEAIHDLLDERIPNTGAGRAGSWQSQLKARKEGLKERMDKLKEKADGKGGMLAGLAGLFGKGKKLFGGDEEEEGDGDTTVIAGGLGGGDGDGKEKKGKKPKGKMGRGFDKLKGWGKKIPGVGKLSNMKMPKGKAGLLASLAGMLGLNAISDKLGGGVGTALEYGSYALAAKSLLAGGGAAASASTAAAATGAAATAATTTAGVGAGTVVGGTALATLGLPLLIGAAVVGAVGYGIYKGYKKYKYGTYTPMRAYRMAQYGVHFSDTSQVEKMVEFEQMVEPHVKGIGGHLDISSDNIAMDEVYKHFGIDDGWFTNNKKEREEFDLWFNKRFKPVFMSWRNSLNSVKSGQTTNDADDSLTSEQKDSVLKSVRGVSRECYTIMVGPFGKIGLSPKDVEEAYTLAVHTVGKEIKNGGKKSLMSKMERLAVAMTPFGGTVAKLIERRDTMFAKVSNWFNKDKGEPKKAGGTLGAVVMGGGSMKGVRLSSSLSALDAVRYRTYGLVDMDTDKVRALASLESDAAAMIRFNQNGEGTFEGDIDKLFEGYSPMFNVNGKKRGDWVSWFQKRFLPTLIQYGAAVRRFGATADFMQTAKTLKPDQQLEVAQETQGAKRTVLLFKLSVWKVTDSPWIDYQLNTDPRTIHDNLMALREAVKKRVMNEDKGKAAGGKGAKGTASSSNADASTRQQTQTSFMDRMKSTIFGTDANPTKVGGMARSARDSVVGAYDTASRTVSNVASGITDGLGFTSPNVGPPPKVSGDAKTRERHLLKEAQKAGISDPTELAMFMAQVAHETGNFKHLFEGMKYNPDRARKIFPKRFRDANHAKQVLAQGDAAFGEAIYGGRKDLGNNQPGDGYRFRGRGLMQLTGRYNYTQFAKWSGIDVVSNPDLVATDPRVAALSAVYYWKKRVQGKAPAGDLRAVTQLINGGTNGIDHRRQLFAQYMQTIKGKMADAGSMTNSVASGNADFSGVNSSVTTTTTANGASGGLAPKTGATPVTTGSSTANESSTGAGYASALNSAANNSIPMPHANTPGSDPARPAALQDEAITQQRQATAQAAVAQDVRAKMSNDEVTRQLATVGSLLKEQLNTQRSMDGKLGDIANLLKGIKGSALAASEQSPSRDGEKTIASRSPARGVPPTETMPQAPISVRRRSVG